MFERLPALTNDVGLPAEEYDTGARRMLENFPQALTRMALINTAHLLSIPEHQAKRASEKGGGGLPPQPRYEGTEDKPVKILVIDVGGSHVKCVASGHRSPVKFESGTKLTPVQMAKNVLRITRGWRYDAVSIGYPGVVRDGEIAREPPNLGAGWVGFDFAAAFACPVKIINDAAMQALGGYQGGKMLFLGLGTGLESALIVDGAIVAMELGHLHYEDGHNYEYYLGRQGRKRLGKKRWRAKVRAVVDGFREALLPDYIVLGGDNAAKLKRLPRQARLGDNAQAFAGGFRLWERQYEAVDGRMDATAD